MNSKKPFVALNTKIKKLKPVPAQESSTIDHNDGIESMKRSIDELNEAFHCLKHTAKHFKSVPAQESSLIDHRDDIESLKQGLNEL